GNPAQPKQHDTSPWVDLGANPYLDWLSTNSNVKQDTKYASSIHFQINTFLLVSCNHKTFFEKLVNPQIGICSAKRRCARSVGACLDEVRGRKPKPYIPPVPYLGRTAGWRLDAPDPLRHAALIECLAPPRVGKCSTERAITGIPGPSS